MIAFITPISVVVLLTAFCRVASHVVPATTLAPQISSQLWSAVSVVYHRTSAAEAQYIDPAGVAPCATLQFAHAVMPASLREAPYVPCGHVATEPVHAAASEVRPDSAPYFPTGQLPHKVPSLHAPATAAPEAGQRRQRLVVVFHTVLAPQSEALTGHTVAASSPGAGQQQSRSYTLIPLEGPTAEHVVEAAPGAPL